MKTVMSKKIIVVDDSLTVRQQLGAELAAAGYEVIEAADGVEGAEKIEATPDVALVITDVNMPLMNGIDMLSLVKKDGRHQDLIVLMLTTESQPGPMAKAKQAGAKGWIVKPVQPDMLLAAVRRLLNVK
jgi:two-component system, chemotaxis family, chemotaxis protein CheY